MGFQLSFGVEQFSALLLMEFRLPPLKIQLMTIFTLELFLLLLFFRQLLLLLLFLRQLTFRKVPDELKIFEESRKDENREKKEIALISKQIKHFFKLKSSNCDKYRLSDS